MKIKILKKFRQKYEYTFCKGKIFVKRKLDGDVNEFNNIQIFIINYIYENFGIISGLSYEKSKILIENKKYSKEKWKLAKNCNQ